MLPDIGESVSGVAGMLHPPINPVLQAHISELYIQYELDGHYVEVWHYWIIARAGPRSVIRRRIFIIMFEYFISHIFSKLSMKRMSKDSLFS